jgi:hypothetical protein
LITFLQKLEKEVDNTVTGHVDAPRSGEDTLTEQATIPSPAGLITAGATVLEISSNNLECTTKSNSTAISKSGSRKKSMPVLKPSQARMVRSLNTHLTRMKKYAAYIHPIRNSHGTIIARDVLRFDFHKEGEGVLRHWADGFIF